MSTWLASLILPTWLLYFMENWQYLLSTFFFGYYIRDGLFKGIAKLTFVVAILLVITIVFTVVEKPQKPTPPQGWWWSQN